MLFVVLYTRLLSPPNNAHYKFPGWDPVSLTTSGRHQRETDILR